MFDHVVWVRAYESGPLRVVYSMRERADQVGLSIEYYGRSERNCWHEVVRLDAYPGDMHVHWFPRQGGSHEKNLSDAADMASELDMIRRFIDAEIPEMIRSCDFADTAADRNRLAAVAALLNEDLLVNFARA